MPYAQLSTEVWKNEKVRGISPQAFFAWVMAISYCAEMLTDGVFTTSQLYRFADHLTAEACAAELVLAGLWHKTTTGYQVHDYLAHNNSRAFVQSRRTNAGAIRSSSYQTPKPQSVARAIVNIQSTKTQDLKDKDQDQGQVQGQGQVLSAQKSRATVSSFAPSVEDSSPEAQGPNTPAALIAAFESLAQQYPKRHNIRAKLPEARAWWLKTKPTAEDQAQMHAALRYLCTTPWAQMPEDMIRWLKHGRWQIEIPDEATQSATDPNMQVALRALAAIGEQTQ